MNIEAPLNGLVSYELVFSKDSKAAGTTEYVYEYYETVKINRKTTWESIVKVDTVIDFGLTTNTKASASVPEVESESEDVTAEFKTHIDFFTQVTRTESDEKDIETKEYKKMTIDLKPDETTEVYQKIISSNSGIHRTQNLFLGKPPNDMNINYKVKITPDWTIADEVLGAFVNVDLSKTLDGGYSLSRDQLILKCWEDFIKVITDNDDNEPMVKIKNVLNEMSQNPVWEYSKVPIISALKDFKYKSVRTLLLILSRGVYEIGINDKVAITLLAKKALSSS
jgi:hypothetical protein